MFEGLALDGLSATTVLALAVILLLTGRIVPRRHLLDKEGEIKRWREAYETEREARNISDSQTQKLLVAIEANRDVMVALLQVVKPEPTSGGSSDATETK